MRTTQRRPRSLAAIAALGVCLSLAAGCGSSKRAATSSDAGRAASSAGGSSLKPIGTPQYASPSRAAPVQSGTVEIAYRNITIHPDTLRVKVGTTIRWRNFDSVQHNVTSQSGPQRFASRNLGEGQTFQVTLTRPGTTHYLCTIHPATMNGTIEVLR